MKKKFFSMALWLSSLGALALISSCRGGYVTNSTYEFSSYYDALPFKMAKVSRPSIPDREVLLSDFGGNGNGTASNTDAFAAAMDYLSSQGGRHLVVPAGIWLTGPIEIKSNIDLHITRNAIILFDADRSLYPIIETSFEGLDTWRCESPVHADHATYRQRFLRGNEKNSREGLRIQWHGNRLAFQERNGQGRQL